MSRIFTLLLVLVFVAFGLFFGTLNEVPVTVDLFFISITRPLALVVIAAFLAGVLLSGTMVYLSMWFGVKRRIRALKSEQAASSSKAMASSHG